MKRTPHETAESQMTAYGLSLPETDVVPGWSPTRTLRVRKRSFAVFGAKGEPRDALTIIVKLPVAAEMVRELPFVRPSKGWWLQHDWVFAHFGPDDDILGQLNLLKDWLRQSYVAMAPKPLGRRVLES